MLDHVNVCKAQVMSMITVIRSRQRREAEGMVGIGFKFPGWTKEMDNVSLKYTKVVILVSKTNLS